MELELKLDSGYDTLRCVRAVTPSKIILDLLRPLSLPPQSAQRNEVHQRRKKEKKKERKGPTFATHPTTRHRCWWVFVLQGLDCRRDLRQELQDLVTTLAASHYRIIIIPKDARKPWLRLAFLVTHQCLCSL